MSHIWGRLARNGHKRLNGVAELNTPWTLPLRNLGPSLAPVANMVYNSRHGAEPQSLILYRVSNDFPARLLLLISNRVAHKKIFWKVKMGSLDIMCINSNEESEAFPRSSTTVKGLVLEQGASEEEKQRVKS